MFKDLYHNAPPVDLLTPVTQDIGALGTTAYTAVDRQDALGGVEFEVFIGTQTSDDAIADDHIAIGLEDSANNSTFATVADADIEGFSVEDTTRTELSYEDEDNGYFKQLDSADDDNMLYILRYTGTKRYVRAKLFEVGTGGSAPVSIAARLVCPRQAGNSSVFPANEG